MVVLSLILVDPAPGYDGWTWLLWGRELADGELDTRGGPAFKPLTVAVCALLAPLGDAATWAWALIARSCAALALWLAFRFARELTGGSLAGGALGAVAVATCGGFLALAASGAETAPLLALALGGTLAWRAGRAEVSLACAAGCALLRVEAWPFLLVAGVIVWRRRPGLRLAVAAAGVAVPALWLVPELVGSGDLLRSGDRARVPNPGVPAAANVPLVAALGHAIALPLWPLWAGVVALALARRRSRESEDLAPALGAAGLAWILLVAMMAQAGFSGEPRYTLPGAALVALAGAVGLTRVTADRRVAAAAALALGVAVVPRLDNYGRIPGEQAYQWELAAQLGEVVDTAGGRERVLACGRPYTGPLRGPMLAYRLDVSRSAVQPDAPPRAPGTVFRSARIAGDRAAPRAPGGFTRVAATPLWSVLSDCRS